MKHHSGIFVTRIFLKGKKNYFIFSEKVKEILKKNEWTLKFKIPKIQNQTNKTSRTNLIPQTNLVPF